MTAFGHGIVVIDKPAGLSSARALAPLKGLAGRRRRVGHAGTLDPFATGVLLGLVGDATRLSALAMALPKTYRAQVRFGIGTDTLDPEGEVVREADPGAHPPAPLQPLLERLTGELDQVPPEHSALKVDGQRAYRRARRGERVALAARRVRLYAARLRDLAWPVATIELRTGAGFYVRAFARDLGRELGLPAHLASLRRSAVGPFAADEGLCPEAVTPDALHAPLELVRAAGLEILDVEPDAALGFAQGRPLARGGEPPRQPVAVVCQGRLVGLGEQRGDGVSPRTILAGARRALEGGA